jgi:hypothetical protein
MSKLNGKQFLPNDVESSAHIARLGSPMQGKAADFHEALAEAVAKIRCTQLAE